MAMPVNMILVVYDILCILSYDFNKLTMLYIHVHISSSMTNKSGLTFFLSIKYLSVCLYTHYSNEAERAKPFISLYSDFELKKPFVRLVYINSDKTLNFDAVIPLKYEGLW